MATPPPPITLPESQTSTIPPPPPTTPPPVQTQTSAPLVYKPRLSRDDRIRILTLRDAGLTYLQISSQLGITHHQVQYTVNSGQISLKKPPGNKAKLSEEDVDRIIAFITVSERTRRLSFEKVIQELDLPVGYTALARALKKRGCVRCKEFRGDKRRRSSPYLTIHTTGTGTAKKKGCKSENFR